MKGDIRLIQVLPTNGIYTLILFLSREICSNVGKLGQQKFPKGYYTYTGSALGKGASGRKHRISRHLRKEKRNFWHVDFFLADERVSVEAIIVTQTDQKLECDSNRYVKRELVAEVPVRGFGASDCKKKMRKPSSIFPRR